jgi:hypothetical protein
MHLAVDGGRGDNSAGSARSEDRGKAGVDDDKVVDNEGNLDGRQRVRCVVA